MSRAALLLVLVLATSCTAVPTLKGIWRYRSFFNLPQFNVTNDQLVFAKGDFNFSVTDSGQITGRLIGGDRASPGKFWTLDVVGYERPTQWLGQDSVEATLVATGIDGTISAGWIYKYNGILVTQWSQGVDQKESWVGTVLRVCCHEPLGLVASFACVRAEGPGPEKF